MELEKDHKLGLKLGLSKGFDLATNKDMDPTLIIILYETTFL